MSDIRHMTQAIKKWFASNDHQMMIRYIKFVQQQWWGKFNEVTSIGYLDNLSFKT